MTPSVGHLALAFLQGSFAFSGWNFLNYVTEELVDPRKCVGQPGWAQGRRGGLSTHPSICACGCAYLCTPLGHACVVLARPMLQEQWPHRGTLTGLVAALLSSC